MPRAEAPSVRSDPERPSASEPVSPERLLARAADRIAAGWCRSNLAEDRRGQSVEPWAEGAVRWSPLGALLAAWIDVGGAGGDSFEIAYAALGLATGGQLEKWNAAPWRTRWHVLSAFTRARENVAVARSQVRARPDRAR
jgi:hypothetical protein